MRLFRCVCVRLCFPVFASLCDIWSKCRWILWQSGRRWNGFGVCMRLCLGALASSCDVWCKYRWMLWHSGWWWSWFAVCATYFVAAFVCVCYVRGKYKWVFRRLRCFRCGNKFPFCGPSGCWWCWCGVRLCVVLWWFHVHLCLDVSCGTGGCECIMGYVSWC